MRKWITYKSEQWGHAMCYIEKAPNKVRRLSYKTVVLSDMIAFSCSFFILIQEEMEGISTQAYTGRL